MVMIDDYGYVVNVAGAVVRDGECLLIERAPDQDHASGLVTLPGGKLEDPPAGEDAIERTVARELREEVGVEIGAAEYVYSSTFEADDGSPCLNVVVRCEYAGGQARPRAPEEVASVHWLSFEEIREREDVPPFTVDYVDRVLGSRGGE